MNIYDLSYSELSKKVKEFNKTVFGKITLFLSYIIPTLILIYIFFFALSTKCYFVVGMCLDNFLPLLLIFVISLVIGTIYYLHELKVFINKKRKVVRTSKKQN